MEESYGRIDADEHDEWAHDNCGNIVPNISHNIHHTDSRANKNPQGNSNEKKIMKP